MIGLQTASFDLARAAPYDAKALLSIRGKEMGLTAENIASAGQFKNIGDDLAEGKPTLPLIYAMQHGSEQQTQLIRDAIEHSNGMEHLEEILTALKQTNALEFTMQKAELEAEKAIACLDFLAESDYKQALISLARIAVDRDH